MMPARTGERREMTIKPATVTFTLWLTILHRRGDGGACFASWRDTASGCSYRYSNARLSRRRRIELKLALEETINHAEDHVIILIDPAAALRPGVQTGKSFLSSSAAR